MLSICIPVCDLGSLAKGCPVVINGESTVLRRVGKYLCYSDGEKEHRCKILESYEMLDGAGVRCMQFSAASDGDENKQHTFVGLDGTVIVEGDQITVVRD
jgi:hypothetical protein